MAAADRPARRAASRSYAVEADARCDQLAKVVDWTSTVASTVDLVRPTTVAIVTHTLAVPAPSLN